MLCFKVTGVMVFDILFQVK